jgi:hypothetical protein
MQVRNNVFFNGPRAAINFNDGFLGGEVPYLRTRLPWEGLKLVLFVKHYNLTQAYKHSDCLLLL